MSDNTKFILRAAKDKAGQDALEEYKDRIAALMGETTGDFLNSDIANRIADLGVAYDKKMKMIEKNYDAALSLLR